MELLLSLPLYNLPTDVWQLVVRYVTFKDITLPHLHQACKRNPRLECVLHQKCLTLLKRFEATSPLPRVLHDIAYYPNESVLHTVNAGDYIFVQYATQLVYHFGKTTIVIPWAHGEACSTFEKSYMSDVNFCLYLYPSQWCWATTHGNKPNYYEFYLTKTGDEAWNVVLVTAYMRGSRFYLHNSIGPAQYFPVSRISRFYLRNEFVWQLWQLPDGRMTGTRTGEGGTYLCY